jgi:hypothetical protein
MMDHNEWAFLAELVLDALASPDHVRADYFETMPAGTVDMGTNDHGTPEALLWVGGASVYRSWRNRQPHYR